MENLKEMNYENFLFSQLFMNYIEGNETQYQELDYDVIYPEVLKHRILFLKSKFNVDVKSEYDCIVDYLTNNIQINMSRRGLARLKKKSDNS